MHTARDRELIREIQTRVGVPETGELDRETLLAVHEVLGIAHKFFTGFLGTGRNNFASAKPSPPAAPVPPAHVPPE